MSQEALEPEVLHRFKNKISIAMGFCRLLVDECEPGDVRRADLVRVQQALQDAIDMLPELAARVR